MRLTRLLAVPLLLAAVAGRLQGQDSLPAAPPAPPRLDSLPLSGWALRVLPSLLPRDSIARLVPPPRSIFDPYDAERAGGEAIARRRLSELATQRQALLEESWRRAARSRLAPPDATLAVRPRPGVGAPAPRPGAPVAVTPRADTGEAFGDTTRAVGAGGVALAVPDSARPRAGLGNLPGGDLFGDYADLGLDLAARLEAKAERQKNESCTASQLLIPGANCEGVFQPQFDFQFQVKTGGVVADRVHLNVDYDSQREFDASNNISVYYQGKTDELLQRLEVGNVSFQPTPSRFITSGIPSGNYGIQAIGQVGPMRFRTIVAQQKGNVVKDKVYTVGDRTLQTLDRDIEDYQVEPRRFFFTIDPRLLATWPNVDILDGQRLAQLGAALPDSLRPTKIYVYRQTIAGPQPNPNGPQFYLNGSRATSRQLFEYLREGVDYYVDPSNLWIALVRPVNQQNERLAIAYTVGAGQRTHAGGTPDLTFVADSQRANLLWEPALASTDSAFHREIRSVYRLGGQDITRATVELRITTGSGDQEKPVGATAATFLQLFGVAQANNPSVFDVDNRLWPRPSDPNYNRDAGGTGTKLIQDNFVVFPSLRPFAREGLAIAPNPANDTIYTTPGEDLYSSRRPPTLYHLRARYQSEGGGETGTLALGSVQVRANSERIAIGGVPLVRGTDYTVDYELGRITFTRPDTLFAQPKSVAVQYEENPLFAAAPTSIFGMAAEFPLTNGQVNLTAISQAQKTTFNRPPLGFEPVSSVVAGVSGDFTFDASLLTRAIEKLPFVESTAPSQIAVSGELATSRPQPNAAGQAYVESFEGEGGITVPLAENAWYYSSLPPTSASLDEAAGIGTIDTTRAAALAWQNNGVFLGANGTTKPAAFTLSQIDNQVVTSGNGFESAEQILWTTLYPLSAGGVVRLRNSRIEPQWTVPDAPSGRRWRSLRVGLAPSGVDLSRVETLEFWALVSTDEDKLRRNPVLTFDFGDISENSISFAPETLTVRPSTTGIDSLYTGKRLAGYDTLDTERNRLSRSFNVAQDDNGLPGDVVRDLVVVDNSGTRVVDSLAICSGGSTSLLSIGDLRTNCTVRNNFLDEEDLDQDFSLNIARPSGESLYRFVVDLSDPRTFSRVGQSFDMPTTETIGGQVATERKRWVLVKVPFRVPDDSLGSPNARRIKALRLTMVSGEGAADAEYTRIGLARLRLVGSPWLKRAETVVRGIGGEEAGSGTVVAGIVGTQDRDSTGNGLFYESPPGVTDEAESKQSGFEGGRVLINERSLRLTAAPASAMATGDRAEAYYRFAEGQKNFMGYEELRVWARGRNHGWGSGGELQFFVKVGRDASNFYLYRTEVNGGRGRDAWLPEVAVDFRRFIALRERVQNVYLQGGQRNTCTGVDSMLIARSRLGAGVPDSAVYAACDDGYMIVTIDPSISPPNLAAVQELAVGMVRVDSASGADRILPGDTLELWVDDMRLTQVVNTPGYAGQVSLDVLAGDVGTLRVNLSRRDPNFRQLGEQPTFLTASALDVSTTLRLDRLLPQGLGLALPFAVSHSSSGSDPTFLQNTDIRGGGIQGLRTPRNASTRVQLGIRRTVPIRGILAPLVNNLEVNGAYGTGSAKSQYAEVTSRSWSASADYRLAAADRSVRLPGWVDRVFGALPGFLENSGAVQSLRKGTIRLSPTQFTLSSAIVRSSDRSLAFLKPASTESDSGRLSENLQHLWRNGGALEFRPWQSVALRWTANSVRDLRRYRDSVLSGLTSGPLSTTGVSPGLVAAGERERLFGLDVGLERERQMSSGLSFAPVVSSWIRPRLELSTQYNFTRNPADRTVLRESDSTGAFRLPRRFSNGQTLNLSLSLDPARTLAGRLGEKSRLRVLERTFTPIDLSWTRSMLSAFDQVPFSPGLAYQFAFGNIGSFRRAGDRLANNAGITRTLGASTRLVLPLGTALSGRFQRNTTQSWARRQNRTQGRVDGLTTTWPDLTLSWNYRPTVKLVQWLVDNVGTNVGYQRVSQLSVTPPNAEGQLEERGQSESARWPVNVSVTWAPFGGLTTAANWSRSTREDSRPGSTNTSATKDMGFDVSRAFPLPASWQAQSDLRTRLGYQASRTESYVFSDANGARSRLSDNGRRAINLNGDADFADNMSGSLTLSRVQTFDNNFERRYTQFVVSAVLNLRFYAGELH